MHPKHHHAVHHRKWKIADENKYLLKSMANLLIPALAIILWILLLFSLKAATHSSMTYEHWTLFSDFGSLCCFYANFSKQIWNIGRLWNHREKEIVINIHLAMASINLIAGSSSLLRFVGWDALCEDTMGWVTTFNSDFAIHINDDMNQVRSAIIVVGRVAGVRTDVGFNRNIHWWDRQAAEPWHHIYRNFGTLHTLWLLLDMGQTNLGLFVVACWIASRLLCEYRHCGVAVHRS